MPSAQLQVVPNTTGDLLAEKASSVAAPSSSVTANLGWSFNLFPVPSADVGWMGRFELPIPNGATITGVSLSLWMFGASFPASQPIDRMTGGLLEADGIWHLLGGGFSSASYATRSLVPWPERDGGTHVDARWFGAAPAFSLASFASSGSGVAMSLGEGIAVTNPVTGLIAKLQSWLNLYGPFIRSGSVSGTDVPVALCLYREFSSAADASEYFTVSSSQRPLSERPILTVTWDDPNPPSTILASSETRPAIRSLPRVGPAIARQAADVRPSPSTFGRIR